MTQQLWTLEEIERLKKLYEEGKSAKEIAPILDRTVSSVENALQFKIRGWNRNAPRVPASCPKCGAVEGEEHLTRYHSKPKNVCAHGKKENEECDRCNAEVSEEI